MKIPEFFAIIVSILFSVVVCLAWKANATPAPIPARMDGGFTLSDFLNLSPATQAGADEINKRTFFAAWIVGLWDDGQDVWRIPSWTSEQLREMLELEPMYPCPGAVIPVICGSLTNARALADSVGVYYDYANDDAEEVCDRIFTAAWDMTEP